MGTIVVDRIIDRVSKKLFDETNIRWDPAELLTDYNAIKNTIVALKPDAYVLTASHQLVAGSKQAIPAAAIAFRRLIRWLGADGETPGNAIRVADRDDLDHARPDWHTESGDSVLHFIHDKLNPRVFYVYPQATGYVEGVWTATPPDSTTPASDVLPLDDIYEECIFRGMMAAAYSKNFKSVDMNKASYYEARFNEFLGLKSTAQYRFAAKSAAQEQAAEMPGGDD